MYSLIRKIEKTTNLAIALSYIFMTLVIAFHIHAVDLEINPLAKVSATSANEEQAAITGYEKCAFIHQASNTVQYFQSNPESISEFTLVAILSTSQINSRSFSQIFFSHLRAPPLFS